MDIIKTLIENLIKVFPKRQECAEICGTLRPPGYYRDSGGLEADPVMELQDGRWAAIKESHYHMIAI